MDIRPLSGAGLDIRVTIPFLFRNERIFWVPLYRLLWKIRWVWRSPLLLVACFTVLQDKEPFPLKELPDAHEPRPAFIGLDCFPCDHELIVHVSFLQGNDGCHFLQAIMVKRVK